MLDPSTGTVPERGEGAGQDLEEGDLVLTKSRSRELPSPRSSPVGDSHSPQ